MKETPNGIILIGEQSLLIQCGELLLSKNEIIKAVISGNSSIGDWCETKGIDFYKTIGSIKGKYPDESFDFIFSITNLKVLPDWLLSLGKRAINFHDGPLPKYAGLNVPVWAILNDEREHGITWHEMTAKVDEGRILAQQLFSIVPGETALSINAKCYQAALESFSRLVKELSTNSNKPISQDLEARSYFDLTRRPAAAGLIDWNDPVENVERLVRALDYGTYANPLVTAKIFLGDELVSVKTAKIVERSTNSSAGEIIEIDSSFLKVACGKGVVELREFTSQNGKTYDCIKALSQANDLSVGSILKNVPSEVRGAISARLAEVCRYEQRWVADLRKADAVPIPYAKKNMSSICAWAKREVTLPSAVLTNKNYTSSPTEFTLGLLSVLMSRLNGKTSFTFAVKANESPSVTPLFVSHLPLTVEIDDNRTFQDFLESVRTRLSRFSKQGGIASDIALREPSLKGHGGLSTFPVKLVFIDNDEEFMPESALGTELLISITKDGGCLSFYYQDEILDAGSIDQLVNQLIVISKAVIEDKTQPILDISILSESDLSSIWKWNSTEEDYDTKACIHHLIEHQTLTTPKEIALIFGKRELDYDGLNRQANQTARLLFEKGVKSGDLVGVMMDRSIDLVAVLIGIHKAGCAYVPLDPVYPAERLLYMVKDSGLSALVTESCHQTKLGQLDAQLILYDELSAELEAFPGDNVNQEVSSESLAYVIYTSGSTGKPKGVMVEHRNATNFFVGMDNCIGKTKGTWLAVTSISFDISVLELFWTLSRGFRVVLYSDPTDHPATSTNSKASLSLNLDFSLFYWNVANEESHHKADKYRLLLDGARFADQHGFKAVWTPERHFASFGGLFPNPSVTSAALATITENVDLRAGSCVIPLHSPIRVAEEWAVVDNLSNGRVGLSVASGWAPPDFAIKPENFQESKKIMFESLDQIKRLWRGEEVTFPGPIEDVVVRTLPRPIQKELPCWVTTAGNIDTFKGAAKAGSNVLTHLLGQTFDEVKGKVDAYRKAWKEAGHEGTGTVTLMLHTFISEDNAKVEEIVRQPMKDYLKSAMFLVKGAAWNFPTFKKMSEETGKSLDEFFETISDTDLDDLLEFAFQRYFRTSGLFGTPETAQDIVAKCDEIGVDEIACLIDFGIDDEIVMDHLPYLNQLKINCSESDISGKVDQTEVLATEEYLSIPALIEKHQVTHFQCTPSMATMLVSDSETKSSLRLIQHMMVGGEAMPSSLAEVLKPSIGGRLTNMYGPTETTVWSSTFDVDIDQPISIGYPIANTKLYIVDQNLNPLPVGVAGELVIGGDGVVRGYLNRPELTKQRFLTDFRLSQDDNIERVYRTGDLVKYAEDGSLFCLGRMDHQVKIRGYRIELGEIEALLQSHDSVRECAVVLREDTEGDKRLVAYVVTHFEQHMDADLLKSHLASQLPDFMIPAFYVGMPSMPLTPNGKLDRNALPEPIQQRHENSDNFVLPESEWENLIADIWKTVLDIPEVGIRDNFFDLGGHSLLIIEVLKQLREHDKISKSIQMTDLFRYTTVEALSKFVASDNEETNVSDEVSSRVTARKAARNRRRKNPPI